jgi:hypothetical protein
VDQWCYSDTGVLADTAAGIYTYMSLMIREWLLTLKLHRIRSREFYRHRHQRPVNTIRKWRSTAEGLRAHGKRRKSLQKK